MDFLFSPVVMCQLNYLLHHHLDVPLLNYM
jgi:hypothetical protein